MIEIKHEIFAMILLIVLMTIGIVQSKDTIDTKIDNINNSNVTLENNFAKTINNIEIVEKNMIVKDKEKDIAKIKSSYNLEMRIFMLLFFDRASLFKNYKNKI